MSPDSPSHLDSGTPPERPARDTTPDGAVDGMLAPHRLSLWRRIQLTWEYLGPRAVAYRVITFPLRFTPLGRRLMLRSGLSAERTHAASWYRRMGRPVSVVIPTYGPPDDVIAAVRSIRKTTRRDKVHIIVVDDGSAPEHVARLQQLRDVQLVLGESNVGFAANANRGLRAADPANDVVLLNSDVIALPDWLACLQYAASSQDDVGIVGAKLLYPDGRIQHAGVHRNLGAPEWFDHRFRFKPGDHEPANVTVAALAVTGACMYVRREVIDRIGLLDERYAMAYEDVDWCLRAWEADFRVVYFPPAVLEHKESVTRGTEVGEREKASQEAFWERWRGFFDERSVATSDGRLRIIYVTEDTGVGGGHRDIFEHLNRLQARGHDVQLFSLGGPPDWFALEAPLRTFEDYEELGAALEQEDAIKVATWWNTGPVVWRASVRRGVPVFFVQDIETSYYPTDARVRAHVLAGYRQEFRYMTISGWNRDRLRELGLDAVLMPPGIDLETFRPLGVQRRDDMLLALGRSNPLKNFPLTVTAWEGLAEPRPELALFGVEPELTPPGRATYEQAPSDERVNELLNQATVFVQTSVHEGFCLPPLEAMATGGAVVCTDAHGNRDFCRDGENCLVPEPTPAAVGAAISRLLADPALRERLGEEGRRTAQDYDWSRRIDALEAYFVEIARAVPAT
jgi:GT2 family glycosyltransferase/glycosyltransferase involved in cell wall biosynthesis